RGSGVRKWFLAEFLKLPTSYSNKEMLRILILPMVGILGRAAVLPLMPLPQIVQPASGNLAITNTFTIAAPDNSDPRLTAAMSRFRDHLARQTGLVFDPAPAAQAQPTLQVQC